MLISLFIACYNDTLFPETGKAVVRVIERLGHTVEFRAAQTCCGQMHYNTGYRPEAVSLMRHFLDVFKGAEVICIPSSSCVSMIRDHFPRMAAEAGVQEEVDDLLPRVFEFTELLIDKLGVTDVGAAFPHSVTLHTSCHALRSLHIGDRPKSEPYRTARQRSVLWIRRHFRHQERRRIRRHARRQDALHSRYRRRSMHGKR